MPTLASSHLPIPKSWEEFEAITIDAVRQRWPSTHFQANGRSGQGQHGVDIFGEDDFGGVIGVQCKKRWNDAPNISEVRDEIARAEAFEPSLNSFFVAISCERDAKLQQEVRQTSTERAKQGQFRVALLFWDDITGDLARDPRLIVKHWPQLRALAHDARAEILTLVKRIRTSSTQLNAQVHHPWGADFRLALARFDTSALRARIPMASAVLPSHLLDLLENLCDACDETNRAQEEISALGGPFVRADDQVVREAVLRRLVPQVAIQSGQVLHALGDRQI